MVQKKGNSAKERAASQRGRVKVLLCRDVESLGRLGDTVGVSVGYARNYLLPRGLAVAATEANLRPLAKEAARRAKARLLDRGRLEAAAAAVQGAEAVIAAKANEQGRLFGSVSAGDIAANLREQGFEVADEVVQLSEHIKEVGTHSVELKFTDDLTAAVSVVVVAAVDDAALPEEHAQADGDESSDRRGQGEE
jgi:large subunit ribosomal protein L9